jgi:erythronate-4-phosphate dehydrogenase
MIRIVADVHIPRIASFLGDTADLRLVPGRDIRRDDLLDADVLVVRSVTRVDRALLHGTNIRLVATATAGIDHVDTEYLSGQRISFRHAAGANAESVVEYVLAALYALSVEAGVPLEERTVGIVGFGNVGGRLAPRLKATGARVLVNDPPLETAVSDFAPGFEAVTLEDLVRRSHVVTLHVPLHRGGDHPTFHLLDAMMLRSLSPGTWLINTSRGEVISESALRSHASTSAAGALVLDVWAAEPRPDPHLVAASRICTPHIAGYGWDAKLAATRSVANAVRTFFGLPSLEEDGTEDPTPLHPPVWRGVEAEWFDSVIRQMYDVDAESTRFRSAYLTSTDPAATFSRFRNEYPQRRSFRRYSIRSDDVLPSRSRVAEILGIRLL